jgi:hypothetical protein
MYESCPEIHPDNIQTTLSPHAFLVWFSVLRLNALAMMKEITTSASC